MVTFRIQFVYRMPSAQTLKTALERIFPNHNIIIGRYGGAYTNLIKSQKLQYRSTDSATLASLLNPMVPWQTIHVNATDATHATIEFVQ